jgi:hypothetical protein
MYKRTNDARNELLPFANYERIALEKAFGFMPSAWKSADQSVAASTTLITDNDLNIQLQAGQHLVTYNLITPSMTAAGGLKFQLALGDGLTVNTAKYTGIFYLTATAPVVVLATAAATPLNGGTTSAWTFVQVIASIDVQNPGTLLFQWAQQAASGSTTIAAGSTVNCVTVAP